MRHTPLSLALATALAAGCAAPKGDTASGDTSASRDTSADTAEDTAATELNGAPPEAPVALPTFAARNQLGEARSDADLRGHPTVLWFYPAAGTFG